MFNINFANDWSQNADLWYQKQLLYQQSHNHFPERSMLGQRTLTVGGSITVQLTSCFTSLESTKQVKMLLIQHKQSS